MLDKIYDLRIGNGGADRYSYINDAINIIGLDPIGFLRLRTARLSEAYLQPFGTVAVGEVFGNESIKDMVSSNFEGSLMDTIRSPAFFPKLWIYIIHYGSIASSAIYMVLQRREYLQWSVLAIVILCFSGAYTILTIIPRYIFPIMPLFLIMAAYVVMDVGYRSRKLLWPMFNRYSSDVTSSTKVPRL